MMRKDCRIHVLYSGSGGNSTFIRVGESAILIDAGKSARALCNALCEIGECISGVDAIFITHEHTDHVSALEIIAKKNNIPIYMTDASAKKFDAVCGSPVHSRLCRCDVEFCVTVGEMTVRSFRTSHDSRMSVGYRIEFPDGDETRAVGYATDVGYVSDTVRENLLGCDAVVIESNHDVDMLMTGPYPRDLKQRVASRRGHLSNRDCADLAAVLAENGTRSFMLAHLSKENNQPEIAYDETVGAVSGSGAAVFVAHPDRPVELMLDGKENDSYDEREIYNPWNA